MLFITELELEAGARAGILIYSKAEFKGKDLTIVSGVHKQISIHLLSKSVDVTFYYFGNTTPNKFNIWSHWVESGMENNTQHIANLVQYFIETPQINFVNSKKYFFQ